MAIGIILGNFVPNTGPALQRGQFVGVSIPIGEYQIHIHWVDGLSNICAAVGLLVMMYPILCKVRYETLHRILYEKAFAVQLAFSFIVNWIVAPLFMVSVFNIGLLPSYDRVAHQSIS